MKILSLATRNLLRNRQRTFAALLTMTVGTMALLLFGGFSRFITYGLQTGYVHHSGHLQLQRSGYFLYGSGDPLSYGISDYQQVVERVRRDPVLGPLIDVVTPTVDLSGIAGNPDGSASRTVLAHGVLADDQARMRRWNEYGIHGASRPYPLQGTAVDAAVTGGGLARVLQLCDVPGVEHCLRSPRSSVTLDDARAQTESPGGSASTGPVAGAAAVPANGSAAPADVLALAAEQAAPVAAPRSRIQLLAASISGAPNVIELNVAGLHVQGARELDDVFLILHLPQAQRLLYGQTPARVTGISILLHHTSQMELARARLQSLLAGELRQQDLEIRDFGELFPFYGQSVRMFHVILGFISVLISVVVLFTVGNAINMAIVERTLEIGTLRAMGLRRHAIRSIFVCEGMLLGISGAVSGGLVALLAAWLINHSGIMWVPPGQVNPVDLTIRLWGEFDLLLKTGAGLVAVAVLSAWWPAHRAARMNIVDALRHV